MSKPFFGDIKPVKYEGPKSDNPYAFRHYDPKRVVMRQDDGRTSTPGGLLLAQLRLARDRHVRRADL